MGLSFFSGNLLLYLANKLFRVCSLHILGCHPSRAWSHRENDYETDVLVLQQQQQQQRPFNGL